MMATQTRMGTWKCTRIAGRSGGETDQPMDAECFVKWLANPSFEAATGVREWLKEARLQRATGADWDLVRRHIAELYANEEPESAGARARVEPMC